MSYRAGDGSAVDLAPRPERSLARALLVGLDKGRSTAMNRFIRENGLPAAVYAVCVQFWVLVAFAMAVLAVAATLAGRHNDVVRAASLAFWALFAVTLLLAIRRYASVARLRRQHRADPNN